MANNKLKTLDLHGFKVADVFDAIDRFIMKNQSAHKVCIMTGKGTGAVQKEALKYLKLGNYPWQHEVMPNGKKNTGCLIVFIG